MKLSKTAIHIMLALGSLMPTLALAQQPGQDYQQLDEIVAVVNDSVILRSELETSVENIAQQIQARGERQPPQQALEAQVLDRLVMNQVQVQRAEETGIMVTDQEVDRALDDVARQNNLSLMQLRQAIERDGMNFNEFRDEVRNELLTSRLQQRVVESMDPVTETEVEILLESDFFEHDEYHLSQIALRVPQAAGPDERREIENRTRQIYQEITSGMDFATAAVRFSEAPDALEGGDIGWRNLNSMPRQLADQISDLEPGQLSEPIVAGGSVLIIKVNDRRPRSEILINEFRARHILIQPTELMSAEQARTLAQDLHERIRQGEDFAELARKFSNDTRSANLGGHMDWFPEGAYGPAIQEVCDTLDPGEVSQPFQSGSGWHIVKLEEKRREDRTREALAAEARNHIMEQRSQEELERAFRQMRNEAYVEVLL